MPSSELAQPSFDAIGGSNPSTLFSADAVSRFFIILSKGFNHVSSSLQDTVQRRNLPTKLRSIYYSMTGTVLS